MSHNITLNEFIIQNQSQYPHAKGCFSQLLSSIQLAAKVVNQKINKAGLSNIIGICTNENSSGEIQQKLDVFANNTFINALNARAVVCGIASEEEENFIYCDKKNKNAPYIVMIDPLDGSSNIDANVSVGTIFSIYKRISPIDDVLNLDDFLRCGHEQVGAGYIIYGSSTMLVFSTGQGVHGFTYDPSIGVFYLSHHNLKIPKKGSIYSINEANYRNFPDNVKSYIKFCQEKINDGKYSSRYIGSLVADFHRNMLYGGIFMYPSTAMHKNGKLRLLYECNPIAYLAHNAGGVAYCDNGPILEITPKSLHQRSSFYVGSKDMVEKLLSFKINKIQSQSKI